MSLYQVIQSIPINQLDKSAQADFTLGELPIELQKIIIKEATLLPAMCKQASFSNLFSNWFAGTSPNTSALVGGALGGLGGLGLHYLREDPEEDISWISRLKSTLIGAGLGSSIGLAPNAVKWMGKYPSVIQANKLYNPNSDLANNR
jgi:hypothetical protein